LISNGLADLNVDDASPVGTTPCFLGRENSDRRRAAGFAFCRRCWVSKSKVVFFDGIFSQTKFEVLLFSSSRSFLSLPAFRLRFPTSSSLLFLFFQTNSKNFYDVLSVPRGASDGQIKRAYRKLALKYHPDKVTGTEQQKASAAKKFAEINAAYEALGNEETRRIYDRFGEEGLKQHQAQNSQGGGGGGGPGGPMGGIFQQ